MISYKEEGMKNLDELAKEYDEFLERNSFDKYSDRKKHKSNHATMHVLETALHKLGEELLSISL